jgi:glucan phosphorylase
MEEIPIDHITNGIHTETWLARRMGILFSRYMGADWADHICDLDFWARVENIPDEELWLVHRHLKRKLVAYIISRGRKNGLATMSTRLKRLPAVFCLILCADDWFCPPFCHL